LYNFTVHFNTKNSTLDSLLVAHTQSSFSPITTIPKSTQQQYHSTGSDPERWDSIQCLQIFSSTLEFTSSAQRWLAD
jgi:hypothetical protein